MKKHRLRAHLIDAGSVIAGSALYAASFNIFLGPNEIAPGGLTGLSMIINRWLPLPVGALIIALNVPLFLGAWRLAGKEFLLKSLAGMLVSSAFIDLLAFLPRYSSDRLLAAIYGGVVMGAGLGLIMLRGATTGGSEIAGKLLRFAFPHVPIGRMVMAVDLIVIALAAAVFRDVNAALYAAVSLYVCTIVLDGIVYGLNYARVVYIISGEHAAITRAVNEETGRGATLLHGEGALGDSKKVILCAIKPSQIAKVKELVKEFDKNAFVIVTEAHEVLGEGFLDHDRPQM